MRRLQKNLPKRESLTCMLCKDDYDLECANLPTTRFYNTMTTDHKQPTNKPRSAYRLSVTCPKQITQTTCSSFAITTISYPRVR